MNTPRRFGAAVALLACGFAAGRFSAPAPAPAVDAARTEQTEARPGAAERASRNAKGVSAADRKAGEETARAAVLRLGTTPASGAAFDELLRALRRWAALDPEAALAHARTHLTLQRRNQAVTEILGDWAGTDAAAAWAWATTEAPENGTHLDAVLSRIALVDGPAAWGHASAFAQARPDQAQSVYASALRGITHAGDFQLAARLLSGTETLASGVRDGLSTLVATEWGRYEPEKAAAWAAELPAGGVAHERAMINVVQAWAEVDPSAASRYATSLPPGGVRQQAVAQALPNWASTEPAQAAQWLFGQEPSGDFDQAVHMISTHPKVMADFASAMTLANSIFDTELRTQSLTRIVATLRERDPAAATRFLDTSADVPAETRAAITARLEANDVYAPGDR